MGCGGGDIPFWLHEHCQRQGLNLKITGIDPDPRAVNFARHRYQGVDGLEINQASLFELPKLGMQFDYVFANHFLHHLTDDELIPALQIIEQVTKRVFLIILRKVTI